MEKINIGTFYFQLDTTWLSDPKIQAIISEFNAEGVGIYITIISWLFNEKGVLNKKCYKYIANQLRCKEELVKQIVEDYDLFYFEGDEFSSHRARLDMEKRLKMAKGGSKGGLNKNKK